MTIKEKIPHYSLFINGEFIEGEKKESIESINPHTGKVWATFSAANDVDVNRAISIAKRSMEKGKWADMLPSMRGKLLFTLADLIEKHASFLGEIETKDSGKLLVETATQTKYVADYYRYYAGLADKIEGATLPIDKPDMHVFTTCEPIGVVAAIVPYCNKTSSGTGSWLRYYYQSI
jgi:aldehyde dehydrogenase (NAD+)